MDEHSELASLRREVAALRQRVAELQRRARAYQPDDSTEFLSVAERTELLREAERITNTGSWVWDMTDQTVFWSDQLFRILGYDPEVDEATTENYFARVHPDDLEYAQAFSARSVETGVAGQADYRLQLPSGEVRWVSLNGAMLYDEAGVLRSVVGTVRDVTDARQAAMALADAHRLEAVGKLAGGVAHDFRNLLTVIRAHVELSPGIEDEPRLAILNAVDSANTVTKQLLGFGQQASLRPIETDLNDVVRQVEQLVAPLMTAPHALELDLTAEKVLSRVDAQHLGEALSNLVLHTRDAMPDGGRLRISTVREAETVCIVIEDDTTEFSPDARVFEPFFRHNVERFDLRVAMAHGIVVQHGGYITVEPSRLGGTAFVMRFKAHGTADDPERLPLPSPGKLTILVVDDQAPVARVVRRLLESEGHTVLVADHPHTALELYGAHHESIDVVLTDLAMPAMLGTELIVEIESRWPIRGVIFMSGYASEAEREIDSSYHLLHKPFTRDQLLDALAQLKV